MNLPKRFSEILEKNKNFLGIVNSTASKYQSILEDSKFEFFDEYTNHGVNHIENVLRTSDWLIPDESIELLNAKDITVLILSTLLHDLGMHLSYEGLRQLIDGGYAGEKIEYFDKMNWNKEWEKYFDEARRWNGKKLRQVFGEERVIRTPPLKKEELNGFDKKLYGEFLRRKHPRLAHEICLFGFPAVNGKVISYAEDLPTSLKDITGVVARSHGLNIRSTFGYLQDKFGQHSWRTPYDVKVIYLMVLLRIADYLHITSDRSIGLQVRSLSSPVSKLEQDKHNAIEFIHLNHDDPESLYVQVKPENSLTFLGLENLFGSIQRELDTSWAVLGEVYGRFENLNNLKMCLRRIQSNLDDKEWFSSKVRYLPKKVTFDSEPELLKLLVAPLYGNNPSYGVRELIQNAIDACKEREHWVQNTSIDNDSFSSYTPEVKINIENDGENKYIFAIEDNGIGMTEDTLIQYFFKAGSSFRNSSSWSKAFVNERGNSEVQRSGKFGVGVLASFLLGEEIYLSTKSVNSDQGLTFSARIDQEQIDVQKIDREVGTTIRIKLSKKVYEELKEQMEHRWTRFNEIHWDRWYVFKRPEIMVKVPKSWDVNKSSDFDLSDMEENSDYWNTIYPDDYEKVDWSYKYGGNDTMLFCNGIIIPEGYRLEKDYLYPSFPETPTISVIDNDGNLPLSLDRNSLSNDLPFETELVQDICKDLIAKLLAFPNIIEKLESVNGEDVFLQHPALRNDWNCADLNEGELLLFNEGYCLPHSFFLDKLGKTKLTRIWTNNEKKLDIGSWINSSGIMVSRRSPQALNEHKQAIYNEALGFGKKYNVLSKRVYIPSNYIKDLYDTSNKFLLLKKDYREGLYIEGKNDMWTCLTFNNPSITSIELDALTDNIELIIEYTISARNTRRDPGKFRDSKKVKDIFSALLAESFEDNVLIPYDYEERKRKFPKAFGELEKYMFKYLEKKFR